jgi:hypothetical protein
MCERKRYITWQMLLLISIFILFNGAKLSEQVFAADNKFIYETPYSHIEISERYEDASIPVKIKDLKIDNVTHAGMYLESDKLVYPYTRYYHLFDTLLPSAQNMLML